MPCAWNLNARYFTSKTRASRLAEVSNFKKRAAIGSQKQVLPIGDATKPHTASQLCSLSSTSFCLIPFQLWPPLLSSSQAISDLLNFCNSFQQLSKLFHLSPPQLKSFHLFPALLNSPWQLSPLPTSSSLFSTLLNSFQLFFNSSHLFSPPPPLNSSHLFLSPSQLFSPIQLWPALLNSFHLLSQRC